MLFRLWCDVSHSSPLWAVDCQVTINKDSCRSWARASLWCWPTSGYPRVCTGGGGVRTWTSVWMWVIMVTATRGCAWSRTSAGRWRHSSPAPVTWPTWRRCARRWGRWWSCCQCLNYWLRPSWFLLVTVSEEQPRNHCLHQVRVDDVCFSKHLFIISRNSGNSIVPFPSRSTCITRLLSSSSVGFCPMALITYNSSLDEIAPLPSWNSFIIHLNSAPDKLWQE